MAKETCDMAHDNYNMAQGTYDMTKDTYGHTCGMRMCQKNPKNTEKEAYILGKATNECADIPVVCVSVKRDHYIYGKRDLLILAYRVVCVCVKRTLFIWQKRPMDTDIRETFQLGRRGKKRDLRSEAESGAGE